MLIYFNTELQQAVLELFAYSLQQSNGYLLLGKAETANEELQAANEELMLTQEEMQATNEELQTTNDELTAEQTNCWS